MDIFDSINLYLLHHPAALAHLEMMFRLKFWILLIMALYFMTLPYRQERKERLRQKTLTAKNGHFLA
jgi:hypothetical protein